MQVVEGKESPEWMCRPAAGSGPTQTKPTHKELAVTEASADSTHSIGQKAASKEQRAPADGDASQQLGPWTEH